VDDVNNMNDSVDAVEPSAGGISRRDMIKASVIAGGLVWTAPVLLSGTAYAQVEACCPTGTPVTVTITPDGQLHCGIAQCLVQAGESFDCDPDMLQCLADSGVDVAITLVNDRNGNPDHTEVHVDLLNGIVLLAVAVNTTGGSNPNHCALVKVINPTTCNFPQAPNNITIPGNRRQVQINFDADVFGLLNQVELTLCIPATFSALCP
jgi:hypothetical protein